MKIYLDYQVVLDGYSYVIESDTFTQFNSLQKKTSDISLPETKSILIAEELPDGVIKSYVEGAVKQITVNAYERDLHARQKCIDYYKGQLENRVVCWVCGFDFGKFYNEEMVDKIHVHHKRPLSEIKGEYQVDPINDLVPLCPNCHYATHVLDCAVEYLKCEVEKRRLSNLVKIPVN